MQPSPGSTPLAVVVLVWGLVCLASACCPCDEAPETLGGDDAPDDSQVEFGSMEPGGPPPDAWASAPPSWGPQLGTSAQTARMLSEATPHASGNVEHALLLCDVFIHNAMQYDTFAFPDPSATLTLGARPPLTLRGGEEEEEMVFTAPGVTVKEGEPWRLLMVDRDLTSEELIGESVATYAGRSPLEISHERFRATCHVLPREAVEPYAVEALKQTDRALSAPELKGAPALGACDLGYPERSFKLAVKGVHGAAALLSWSDRRVQDRVMRWEEAEALWRASADDAIQAELKQHDPSGWRAIPGWEGLLVHVSEMSCPETPSRSQCSVTLELKNTGALELVLKPEEGLITTTSFFTHLVFEGGTIEEAALAIVSGQSAVFYIKPGAQLTWLFELDPSLLKEPPRRLIGVQFGKNERAVLLRPPSEVPR